MNDILTSRFKNYPNKNFIFYNNDIIQYKDFYYFVRNAEKNLTNIKYEYVGIKIQDKLKLLIAISALNRLGKIPVIYPNLPNLEDYINQTQVPITVEDKDITCNNKKCAYKKIDINLDNTQLVLFTSGTTNIPKPCELTYRNFCESSNAWNKAIHFNENNIYLNHMPLNHVSGLCIFFRSLHLNFSMLLDDFNTNQYFEKLKKYSVTHVSMVPTMLNQIIQKYKSCKELKILKALIIGGSSISKQLKDKMIKNDLPAYMSYGMTETTSGIAGYWICKSNAYESHNDVNIYVKNNLAHIKSKTIMKKYMNEKLSNDYFKTNDIIKIKKDNSFNILGRADDVIISGGENISLEYVKKHIEKIDGVDFCKLKKVESSTWGQVLHASIKCSKNITEHSIRRKLNDRLANYMIPKKIIII